MTHPSSIQEAFLEHLGCAGSAPDAGEAMRGHTTGSQSAPGNASFLYFFVLVFPTELMAGTKIPSLERHPVRARSPVNRRKAMFRFPEALEGWPGRDVAFRARGGSHACSGLTVLLEPHAGWRKQLGASSGWFSGGAGLPPTWHPRRASSR